MTLFAWEKLFGLLNPSLGVRVGQAHFMRKFNHQVAGRVLDIIFMARGYYV